jgi:hypothetical protein
MWTAIGLIIATMPLIAGSTWSVFEHRRRTKIADDWSNFRTPNRR